MIYKVPIDTLHLYTYVYRDYGYIIRIIYYITRATLNGDTITSSLITGIIFSQGNSIKYYFIS